MQGYTLPKYKSVGDKFLLWHVAKLSEECGEVCQSLLKDKSYEETASECIDVIQCAENILRRIGISENELVELKKKHVIKDAKRGYIEEELWQSLIG